MCQPITSFPREFFTMTFNLLPKRSYKRLFTLGKNRWRTVDLRKKLKVMYVSDTVHRRTENKSYYIFIQWFITTGPVQARVYMAKGLLYQRT